MQKTLLYPIIFLLSIILYSCEENSSESIGNNNTDIANAKLELNKSDTFYIDYLNHYVTKNDTLKVNEIWTFLQTNNIKIAENYVAYANFLNQNRTRNDDAIALYKEAIMINPTYYLPYKIIGNLYIHYNMLQDALNYLVEANRLEPNDIEVINNIANIYFVDKQYNIAVSYYTQAIRVAPNEVVYTNRALCYENIGEYELAKQDYAMAESFK